MATLNPYAQVQHFLDDNPTSTIINACHMLGFSKETYKYWRLKTTEAAALGTKVPYAKKKTRKKTVAKASVMPQASPFDPDVFHFAREQEAPAPIKKENQVTAVFGDAESVAKILKDLGYRQ